MKKKCDVYWPEKLKSSVYYGDIKITLISYLEKPHFTIRKFFAESVNIHFKLSKNYFI